MSKTNIRTGRSTGRDDGAVETSLCDDIDLLKTWSANPQGELPDVVAELLDIESPVAKRHKKVITDLDSWV